METAFMFDTDDDGQNVCFTCNGSGVKLVCCDDICLGQGYCMHGDGEETCPACHGSGGGG